ncbi:RNA polymerase sigma factor, sigma-70 family [Psychrobacillus psychrotolerans]|uniref:RNA polymerase sigma factor, sigma-70 family n=1 Tax=Psychrobacillus psychrotolerans TaxID=126156 RepID=A0A1I5Z5L7_9BACI|nr:sigma-70 family RNA polymerase sigma factor [Psychrobacillus psychrotolerans]SFQ51740.1 RNA polymerase sigma factor, sigma-70 family [Psychrobacillus psychrotolerans]
MTDFEEVLEQFEPMISACIRKLSIYKNHEIYRQAGRIALWKAWVKFDEDKGDFAPYAYRSIYGGMLDELKKEKQQEEHADLVEDEKLAVLLEKNLVLSIVSEDLERAIESLQAQERELLMWIFVEGISLQQASTRVGITIPGIKKRRERMLVKLREQIKR